MELRDWGTYTLGYLYRHELQIWSANHGRHTVTFLYYISHLLHSRRRRNTNCIITQTYNFLMNIYNSHPHIQRWTFSIRHKWNGNCELSEVTEKVRQWQNCFCLFCCFLGLLQQVNSRSWNNTSLCNQKIRYLDYFNRLKI